MDENASRETTGGPNEDVRSTIREVIQEFVKTEQSKSEPAYKVELLDERKRREQLERRVNELVEENRRARIQAEEADRSATIRSELQRLGVAKVDLAFKAVKDEITRSEDGRLVARAGGSDVTLKDYLTQFVGDNPELLPARGAGGSGAGTRERASSQSSSIDLERIRPGMSAEDLEKARQEIARVAAQTLRGI